MAVDNARLYHEAQPGPRGGRGGQPGQGPVPRRAQPRAADPADTRARRVSAMLDDPATPDSVRPALEMIRRNVELEARLIDDLLDVTRIVQGKLRLNREVVDAHDLIHQAAGDLPRRDRRPPGSASSWTSGAARPPRRGRPGAAPAGLLEPDQERRQVHPRRAARSRSGPATDGRPAGRRGDRHRHRDRAGGPAPDLRRLRAGRRLGHPAVRRPRPRPGDQPEPRRGPRRPARRRERRARAEGRPSPSSCPPSRRPSRSPPRPRRRSPTSARARRRSGSCWSRTTPTRSGSWPGCCASAGIDVDDGRRRRRGARRSAEAGEFDLIISDIGLPDGSGLDLMRRLRAGAGRSPAIALTGYGMEEDIRRSREAGFAAHLTKPIDFPSSKTRSPASRRPGGRADLSDSNPEGESGLCWLPSLWERAGVRVSASYEALHDLGTHPAIPNGARSPIQLGVIELASRSRRGGSGLATTTWRPGSLRSRLASSLPRCTCPARRPGHRPRPPGPDARDAARLTRAERDLSAPTLEHAKLNRNHR